MIAQKVLNQLGEVFGSYTFTNKTSDYFEAAKTSFKAHADKLIFKELDIEQEITEQEFTANSYDLVISTLAVSQSESPEKALAKARELLKPGGYLLLLEATNNKVHPNRFGPRRPHGILVPGKLGQRAAADWLYWD